jgi:serine/threonine protein phosphatase 1
VWRSLFSPRNKRPARLPDGVRIYAIGDVHGRIDLLDDVLSYIDEDLRSYPVFQPLEVFLGDYVDRGPASREVLERLIARSTAHDVVYLKGNHESFLMSFLKTPDTLEEWRHYGGLDTLISYGLSPPLKAQPDEQAKLADALDQVLPPSHRLFLNTLKPWFACGDFFFVHAGVRPGVPLQQQREEDLLWIREDFLLHEEPFEKMIVHGHTPVLQPDVRPNRINIDTGAYATGKLTCLVLEADKMLFI